MSSTDPFAPPTGAVPIVKGPVEDAPETVDNPVETPEVTPDEVEAPPSGGVPEPTNVVYDESTDG